MADVTNSGLLGENWTALLSGPSRVDFWRVTNTSGAPVTVYAGVQAAGGGDVTPAGQADLAGNGGFVDFVDGGLELPLGTGEVAVGRCSVAGSGRFRIGGGVTV